MPKNDSPADLKTTALRPSVPARDAELPTIDHATSAFNNGSIATEFSQSPGQFDTIASGVQTAKQSDLKQPFGDYELIGEIARGGMGVVYKARQPRLNRTVAIKMILAGNLASETEVKRFHLEASAAAQLDHSGIVPIYEVGELNGQHFFSMAFVDGTSLQEKLKQGPLQPSLAASLLSEIANAVYYAHSRGIIHRDLKPHNILLDSQGRPKLTDFGLAKNVDSVDGLTATGDIMGTPSYMAPEQASGRTHELGKLTDVYSLGAILYATLTGRPPFQAATLIETLRQVVEQDPVPPTLLNPSVPRDLETICLKCLQKEPAKRYDSAASLAADLNRFIRGTPIQARPVGRLEIAWRWCWRNPLLAGAVATAVLALVGLTSLGFAMYLKEAHHADTLNSEITAKQEALTRAETLKVRAEELKTLADKESEEARAQSLLAKQNSELSRLRLHQLQRETAQLMLERGIGLCEQGEISKGLLWLARALESSVQAEHAALESVARQQIGAWSQRIHPWKQALEHPGTLFANTLSPDGTKLATGGSDRRVLLWDTQTMTRLGVPLEHPNTIHAIAFHPNGNVLAVGGNGFGVRLWNLKTQQPLAEPLDYAGTVYSLSFDSQGKTLVAAGSGGKVQRWNTSTGKPLENEITVTGNVLSAVFSPDGQRLVIGTSPSPRGDAVYSGEVFVFDSASGTEIHPPIKHPGGVHSIVFHPNGKSFFTGCYDLKVRQFDVMNAALMGTPVTHSSQVFSLAISGDGQQLLVGGRDYIARLYDLTTEQAVGQPLTHQDAVFSVALSRNGKQMFTAGGEGNLHIWNIARVRPLIPPLSTWSKSGGVAISPDGKHLFVADQSRLAARKWDAVTGQLLGNAHHDDLHLYCVAVSPDGLKLATGPTETGHARIWNAMTGEPIGQPMPHKHHVRNVCFSNDGKLLATASFDKTARVWDAESGLPVTPSLQHQDFVWCVKFSPDGKILYSVGEDRLLKRWDVTNGSPIDPPLEHPAEVFSVDISPDGRFALTACRDHLVRLWNLETGALEGLPIVCGIEARCAVFNHEGTSILTGCRDGNVQLWDLVTRRPIGAPIAHPDIVDMVLFHPHERSVMTWCRDGNARLWPIPIAADGQPEQVVKACERLAGMTLDTEGIYHRFSMDQRRDRQQ